MPDASTSPATSPDNQSPAGAYNPAMGYLNAESRRTLSSPVFQTAPSSVAIPRDTVVKRMFLKLILSTQVTYASGAPTSSTQGVFDRICTNIELNVGGSRIIKSVRPHLARMMNILMNGQPPRRAYSTSAAAPVTTRAGREWIAGVLAYPATTQYFLFNEGIELYFENPLAYGGAKRAQSELDLRDVSSADLRFTWAGITNLLQDGNGATVTYGTPSVQINPQIIENRARPRPAPGDVLVDYYESYFARTYTGQARAQQIDLMTGNFLMAIAMFVNNGDANLSPADNLLTNIALLVNGATAVQGPVSFQDLQDDNQQRFMADSLLGLNDLGATFASVAGVHPLQGFALMNLVRNGDWNTAINTSRQAGTDSLKIQFDTPATTGTDAATYTNPLQVTVHTHEMRPFVYSR